MERHDTAGIERRGEEWIGGERSGPDWSGKAGEDWRGEERSGPDWSGKAGEDWIGAERSGKERHGRKGGERIGKEGSGEELHGRQEWKGGEWRGLEWSGKARHGRHLLQKAENKMLDLEREAIEDLISENGGYVRPADVVEAARNDESPLHKHFTWDDNKAASEYRLHQARALIARCRIKLEEGNTIVVRAFVSIPEDRRNKMGYRQRIDVVDDVNARESLRREMLSKVDYWTEQAALLSPRSRVALSVLSTALHDELSQVAA